MDDLKWEINSIEDARIVINVLHRRSIRDLASINVLEAQVAYLMCPRWRFLERSVLKKKISYAEARRR